MNVSMTDEEREVLDLAGQLAMKFAALPPVHPNDMPEVAQAVHVIQNIVLARPTLRAMQVERQLNTQPQNGNGHP